MAVEQSRDARDVFVYCSLYCLHQAWILEPIKANPYRYPCQHLVHLPRQRPSGVRGVAVLLLVYLFDLNRLY